MMSRFIMMYVLLLLPIATRAQTKGEEQQLKNLVNDFKGLRNLTYDYEMDVKFPNGQQDHTKGTSYVNNDDWEYYNDCDAFTMIYTRHWFYKADHRKKELTIVDMDKSGNKQLKKATEKDIFQNGAVTTFLDSVLLKTAIVNKAKRNGDTLDIVLAFKRNSTMKSMNVLYDFGRHLPLEYGIAVMHPWQHTPKGIQAVESTIDCRNFRRATGRSLPNENEYFAYRKGKLEVRKYKNYKLSAKM